MESILVLGSGSREHCIAEYLSKSQEISTVFIFPGNDGITQFNCNNIVKVILKNTFDDILFFCNTNNIKYVFPGSENYLAEGIVDFLDENDIKCFGPTKKNSILESCKITSKNIMKYYNIQNTSFSIFSDMENVRNFISLNYGKDFVVKNPNLAGGKGVFIPDNIKELFEISESLLNDNEKIIIEERIEGEEVSLLGFCNGKEIEFMPQSQDYKKLYDNDEGPNTGGMGSVCPVNILTKEELYDLKQKLNKLVKDFHYKGVLYTGIMKTKKGVYVLEFNCRFGDPETQVLLNLSDFDLFEIIKKCINGEKVNTKWKNGFCSNVVMSHLSYPYSKSSEPFEVSFGKLDKNIKIYSGNLKLHKNKYYSDGGRILSLTNYSNNPYQCFNTLYNNIYNIIYRNRYFRKDIGLSLINKKNDKKVKIAILGSTKGSSTQKLIEKCKNLNVSIEIIVSNRRDSIILERAKRCNITNIYLNPKSFKTREDYDKKLINIFKLFDIDFIFLIGYMKILTSKFIGEYRDKILNVHPSLLPSYKGLMDREVHELVLSNREKFSGCTVHHVTEKVDEGNIILQKQYLIKQNETIDSLKLEIQKLESDAIIEALNIVKEGKISYKDTGVNIDEGNGVVNMIKSLSPQLEKDIGNFSCVYEYNGMKLATSTDGVGSKLEIAIELNILNTIGIDLVAMVVNDLYCSGAKPLFFLDYLAMDKVEKNKCKNIIEGINKGCEIANCKLVGGETAEMPSLYTKDKFDLAGFGVGIIESELPKKINKGDVIYGIKSSGIHSNGYSLVRKLLKSSTYDMKKILQPTRIYNEIPEIQKKYRDSLLGICHVTGGGIVENLPRILPSDLTFTLREWELPDIFKWIQKESKMSKEEMMRVFNCGYGMLFIFKKDTVITEEQFDCLGEII